jgi:hypothetical protein
MPCMSTLHEAPPARLTSLGPWEFDAADGVLRGADGTSKIEDRAARTLALLCANRGDIVSQAMILDAVWQGRHVSPNSVAVVIADLRRALGDDAREPLYIETVAKRGYRLKGAPASPPAPLVVAPDMRRRKPRYLSLAYLAAAIALIGTVATIAQWIDHRPAHLRIAIESVRNDTGLSSYTPLATAMGELLVDRISTFDAVDVYRQARTEGLATPAPGLTVESKLILWNGVPTLSMTSEDGGGHVVWTGMAEGASDTLAEKTITALKGLQQQIRPRADAMDRDAHP